MICVSYSYSTFILRSFAPSVTSPFIFIQCLFSIYIAGRESKRALISSMASAGGKGKNANITLHKGNSFTNFCNLFGFSVPTVFSRRLGWRIQPLFCADCFLPRTSYSIRSFVRPFGHPFVRCNVCPSVTLKKERAYILIILCMWRGGLYAPFKDHFVTLCNSIIVIMENHGVGPSIGVAFRRFVLV